MTPVLLLLFTVAASGAQHEGHERPGEGSGTSWQPASTPMEGYHLASGRWSFMVHGFLNLVYQEESEPRGREEAFSTNMLMIAAERPLGAGRIMFRAMTSLEPAKGERGYPLLLQTGESADGRNPLFDRQHPHDLFMELAASYERPVSSAGAVFLYFAPVGEPALGPPAFMHRFSGLDYPIAPLSHHWLDATHISHGVLTAGWSWGGKWKIDGSLFNGREPDSSRWDLDGFDLDSFSARLTFHPSPHWSLQGSAARLSEPERLHPSLDVIRFTASATYNRPLPRGNWQTTLAYGRNDTGRLEAPPESLPPGVHLHFTPGVSPVQHAVLAETGARFAHRHAVFARLEWVEKNELFLAADRRHDLIYPVAKLGFGYVFDFFRISDLRIGAGAYGSFQRVPPDLEIVYGSRPRSLGVFFRLRIV